MIKERGGFSGQNQSIENFAFFSQLNDTSINSYKSQILNRNIIPQEFVGLTITEVKEHFSNLSRENELSFCLNLIAATEARLRMDYKIRSTEKLKDDLSRDFRNSYQEHGDKVSLEAIILEGWKERHPEHKAYISEYKSVLKLRHWLAHGRYWVPKIGRKYDSTTVYVICENIVKKLPLNI